MKFSKKFFSYCIMITLSLCVMLYGVFAALNVSLQVYGNLSFIPHDCEGTAQIISVIGALNENGTAYTLAQADAENVINWQDSATLMLTNPIYLDDISTRTPSGDYINEDVKIAPIVITLKLTNTSKFQIKTIAKTNEQLRTAEEPPANISGLKYSYPKIVLEKSGEEGASTETFAITITPDSSIITGPITITSLALSVEISKNI